jgi:hypothetical protein
MKRFGRLSGADRLMVVEALLLLGIARAAVLLLPFRWIARRLGVQREGGAPALTPAAPADALLNHIARVVSGVAVRVPWDANCLAQAIAAKVMLRRRGVPSTLRLGVARDAAGALEAHAWLSVGEVIVTGGRIAGRYAAIASYS